VFVWSFYPKHQNTNTFNIYFFQRETNNLGQERVDVKPRPTLWYPALQRQQRLNLGNSASEQVGRTPQHHLRHRASAQGCTITPEYGTDQCYVRDTVIRCSDQGISIIQWPCSMETYSHLQSGADGFWIFWLNRDRVQRIKFRCNHQFRLFTGPAKGYSGKRG
jgi:hypothetical protein